MQTFKKCEHDVTDANAEKTENVYDKWTTFENMELINMTYIIKTLKMMTMEKYKH